MHNLQRVRRYQRELEEAEGRAEMSESSLNLIRAKHRSSVVTSKSSSAKVNSDLDDTYPRSSRVLDLAEDRYARGPLDVSTRPTELRHSVTGLVYEVPRRPCGVRNYLDALAEAYFK